MLAGLLTGAGRGEGLGATFAVLRGLLVFCVEAGFGRSACFVRVDVPGCPARVMAPAGFMVGGADTRAGLGRASDLSGMENLGVLLTD